jgi:hypothetical protein
MAKTNLQESADTRSAGIYGLALGAVLGALGIGAFAIVLGIFGVAHGGVALSMIAGGAVGGLAGLMYGVLSVRRRPLAH